MPKLKPDPISNSDIVDFLKTGDDFPLEMRVLHACAEAGFQATHGGSYQDPATGKDRQFDIRALLTQGPCTVKLAIECKNLKQSFPLLVSRVPRRPGEAYHGIIFSNYSPGRPIDGSAQVRYWPVEESPYSLAKQVGKSTIQIGRSEKQEWVTGDAEVYEKWAQAVSSSVELIHLSLRDNHLIGVDKAATVVIPILVVANQTLFAADYDETGALLGVTEAEECYLYLGKNVDIKLPKLEYKISHLGIFTETKFTDYLNRISVNNKYWDLLFPDGVNRLL